MSQLDTQDPDVMQMDPFADNETDAPDPNATEGPDTQPDGAPDPATPPEGDAPPVGDAPPQPPVDYANLDPGLIPHEVAQQTRAAQGMLRELQQERGNTATLTAELALARNAAAQPPPPPQDPEYDPDEPATQGDIATIVGREFEKFQKEQQERAAADAKAAEERRVEDSFQRLATDPHVLALPDHLQPGQVIREGYGQLQQQNLRFAEALKYEPEPAKAIYLAILNRVPTIRQRFMAHRAGNSQPQPNQPPPPAPPPQPNQPPEDIQFLNELIGRYEGKTPLEAAAQTPDDWFRLEYPSGIQAAQ